MAMTSVGSGKVSGGSVSGFSLLESVSPVEVTDSFAIAPISPAFSSPIGSCSLPWRSSSWPMRSSWPRAWFQAWPCEWSVPGQDAQVGEPADERVRGGLEHAGEERAVRIRGDLDLGAALVERRDRALVGRGGEVADDRVEQRLQPDPAVRAADEHGREDRLLDALAEARLELGVGDLLALEVLHQDVVVGLGGGLEELVPPARHLVGHARRGSATRPPCRPGT